MFSTKSSIVLGSATVPCQPTSKVVYGQSTSSSSLGPCALFAFTEWEQIENPAEGEVKGQRVRKKSEMCYICHLTA